MGTYTHALSRCFGFARKIFLIVVVLLIAGCAPRDVVYYPTPMQRTPGGSALLPQFGSTPEQIGWPTVTPNPTLSELSTRAAALLTATPPGTARPSPTLFLTYTPLPTFTPFPSPEPLPTNTPADTTNLQGWGPWALIPSREGLWAMRERDGVVVKLSNDPIYNIYVSPSGRVAAYVTHANPFNTLEQQPYGYTLKVIFPYTGEVRTITTLDPPGVAAAQNGQVAAADLEIAFQAMSAFNNGGVDWSPGENYLAFVSPHEGPSAEVYTYHILSGILNRLTSTDLTEGPAHAYRLSFSPSGQRIYHARAYNFGTGEGYWMAGAWVVDLKGKLVQVSEGDSTGETLVAWVNNQRPLLSSTRRDCGEQNLRTVDLTTGQVQIMWPGCIDDRSYNRRLGEVVISVSAQTALIQPGNLEGVHRIRLFDGRVTTITEHGFEKLYTGQGPYNWYAYNDWEGLFGLDRSGTITPILTGPPYDGTVPGFNPLRQLTSSREWLYSGDGLYLAQNVNGAPQEPALILPMDVSSFTASQNINGVYYFIANQGAGDRIYRVNTKDWQPEVLDERITSPSTIIWVP